MQIQKQKLERGWRAIFCYGCSRLLSVRSLPYTPSVSYHSGFFFFSSWNWKEDINIIIWPWRTSGP